MADHGDGLTLSIARDITTAHGGTLTVAATFPDDQGTGHGAEFTVRLPAASS